MSQKTMLSVSDIAKELNAGKTTIKFVLKRFQKWLPSELTDGQPLYPRSTLKIIIIIQENLEAGFLLSDIEKKLDSFSNPKPSNFNSSDLLDTLVSSPQNGDIRLSNDGLILLKSLVNDIGDQQKRVAMAHEKRANAEERKAVAIEKRAWAEEKKAQAMNNIASALQEMNKLRVNDSETIQIAHEAATAIAIDEDIDFHENQEDLQDRNESVGTDDLSLLIKEEDKIEPVDEDLFELDDLSLLLDEKKSKKIKLDDLSELINTSSDVEDSEPNQPVQNMDDLDDLSALIDDNHSDRTDSEQLDDLSLLIDSQSGNTDNKKSEETKDSADQIVELDDLSRLIDKPLNQKSQDMDDLSQLIDKTTQNDQHPDQALDDLDDLASLIEDDLPETDDLSKLINHDSEPTDDIPAIKVDISPEEDLGKYKAAIMKIIIGLKTDGINIEDATNRLNKNKVKTISGKPEWTQKAISQIYKFIESAQ